MDNQAQIDHNDSLEQIKIVTSFSEYLSDSVAGPPFNRGLSLSTSYNRKTKKDVKRLEHIAHILARYPHDEVFVGVLYQYNGYCPYPGLFVAAQASPYPIEDLCQETERLVPEFSPWDRRKSPAPTHRLHFEKHWDILKALHSPCLDLTGPTSQQQVARMQTAGETQASCRKSARTTFQSYVLRSCFPEFKYRLDFGTHHSSFVDFFRQPPPQPEGMQGRLSDFLQILYEECSDANQENLETGHLGGHERRLVRLKKMARRLRLTENVPDDVPALVEMDVMDPSIFQWVHIIIRDAFKALVAATDASYLDGQDTSGDGNDLVERQCNFGKSLARVEELMKIYMHIIDVSYGSRNLLSLPRVWSNWSVNDHEADYQLRSGDAGSLVDDDYTRAEWRKLSWAECCKAWLHSLTDHYDAAKALTNKKLASSFTIQSNNIQFIWMDEPEAYPPNALDYLGVIQKAFPSPKTNLDDQVLNAFRIFNSANAFNQIPSRLPTRPFLGSYLADHLMLVRTPPSQLPRLHTTARPRIACNRQITFAEGVTIEAILSEGWSAYEHSTVGNGLGMPVSSSVYALSMYPRVSTSAAQLALRTLRRDLRDRCEKGLVLARIKDRAEELNEADL